MKIIKYISILLLLVFAIQVKSQDPQFSQFYSSPLYLSPSLAGATERARIISNYRNQWANLPKAFTTYAFSFDNYLYNYKSGIGALILRNQEGGVYNTTSAGLIYSYTIDINEKLQIRPGIHSAYYSKSIDYSALEFGDQLIRNSTSTVELIDYAHVEHFDFSSSILAYTSNYWIGFTGDHLMALNKQFAEDNTYPSMKISIYGGVKLKIFENLRSKTDRFYTISFFYRTQAGFHLLDLGTNYEKDPLRIGLWFRSNPSPFSLNAVIILLGYTYKDLLINYSYDIATSGLFGSTGGSHEISVAYQFDLEWGGKKKKMGAIPCPHF